MDFNVVPFNQKGITSYLTKIKCSEIPINLNKDRLVVDQKSADNPNGYQRPDSPSRWKAFGNFMESDNGFCPVPLVGNVRSDGRKSFNIEYKNGKINIPDDIKIYICEGQHRLKGYQYMLNEYQIDVDIPLVLINESRDQEVINFHYINDKQKSVATDLTNTILREYIKKTGANLFGIKLTDEKQLAIDVTSMLNDDSSGPFYQNIQLTGTGIKSTIKAIPMHNVITELVKEIDDGALCEDEEVPTLAFTIVRNAWKSLKELMPNAFNDSNEYVLLKSAGIYSVNRVINKSIFKMKGFTENDFYKMFSSPYTKEMFTESWWKSKDGDPMGAVNYGSSQGAFRRIQKVLQRGVNDYLNTLKQ